MISATILHEAETELWDAVTFYEGKSPGLGLDFLGEFSDSVKVIQQSPKRWPLRDDGTRRYLMRRFPYLVVYLYHENQIWIVAVAHCKRRPGYWSPRIRMPKRPNAPERE